ncbi:MAG: ISL3 family transposase, partial [Candidatus Pacebacteria bacterium]|nr:ISL3 family transposase [Candidatus Paceibacterota bacterium]
KDIQFDSENKRLDIHIDFHKGSEFHYESNEDNIEGDFKAYDTQLKQWRHLNFFEHECYLNARVPRIKIDEKRIRLIQPPWSGLSNGFTLLFEALALQLASHMPVNTVSKIISESNDKIWAMLERYTTKALANNDYGKLTAVGMDETSKRKGHDYITLFVDLLQKRTIFIAEGKDHKTVKSFAEDVKAHNGDPDKIVDVSCDMSPAFIKGVSEYLSKAKITFDRFHIMKIINVAVDEVRRQESKEQDMLKGNRYIFLKNEKNLTQKQSQTREELSLSKLNLKSIRALHIRENFQEIYTAPTEEKFETLLKKWYFWATHSRLEPIKEAAYTIKNHWDGVLQWKKSSINNGLLEGLNSLIQAAKAKARGFRNIRYFKIIAFLVTGKLDFSQLNKHYLPT